MKAALVTFGDENVREWTRVSFPLKERYCRLHGYGFHSAGERLDDRPAGWSKIPLLLRHLADYELLYWSDADSVIMQPAVRLEEPADPKAELTFSIAGLHGTLNSGEFFVRNSPWARDFLETVYAQEFLVNNERGRPKTPGHWLRRKLCGCVGCRKFQYDQKAFTHVVHHLDPAERESRLAFYPPEHPLYFNGYGEHYREGVFVRHFPGSHKNHTAFQAAAAEAERRLEALGG